MALLDPTSPKSIPALKPLLPGWPPGGSSDTAELGLPLQLQLPLSGMLFLLIWIGGGAPSFFFRSLHKYPPLGGNQLTYMSSPYPTHLAPLHSICRFLKVQIYLIFLISCPLTKI